MLRKPAPHHDEVIDTVAGFAHMLLVGRLGVNVDLHREAFGEHGIDGMIKAAKEISVESFVVLGSLFEGHRIDAEAHIVEPQLRHQSDVAVIGVAAGTGCGVIIGRLREPLGGVDAVAQMLGAGKGSLQAGSAVLCESRQRKSNHEEQQTIARQHSLVSRILRLNPTGNHTTFAGHSRGGEV